MARLRGGGTSRGPWESSRRGFGTDADGLDYLERVRWPQGFVCPECGIRRGRPLGDGWIMCAVCGHLTSVTVGTIFDRTRTPLTVWGHRVLAARHG